jgi:hypothetical protein
MAFPNYYYLPMIDDGGAISPPSQADILQWLNGTSDGLTLEDKVNPLKVSPVPNVGGGNCLVFNGVDEFAEISTLGAVADRIVIEAGDVVEFELAVISNPDGASGSLRGVLSEPGSNDSINIADNDSGAISIRENLGAIKTSASTYFKVSDGRTKCRIIVTDETTVAIFKDGAFIENLAVNMVGLRFRILSDNPGGSPRELNASWSLLRIERGGVDVLHCDFSGGSLNRVYDSSAQHRYLKIAGDQSTMWSTTDDRVAVNTLSGFSKREYPTDIDVIICAGQSNMSGGQQTGDNPEIAIAIQSCLFGYNITNGNYQGDLEYVGLMAGNVWGPEIQAAYEFAQDGRMVCFIKVSKGGTNLAVDWQKTTADMYNDLAVQVAATLAELTILGFNPQIKQFWWMQGENDAAVEAYANAYVSNFNTFWADMLADGIIATGTKLVIPQISVPAYQYRTAVRDAAVTLAAAKGGYTFDTASYPLESDNVHYTVAGQLLLGADFASNFTDAIPLTKLYTVNVPVSVNDSTFDATASPLTNPGGYVHNGSETSIQQQDTTYDIFDGASFWGNNVDTWDEKTSANLLAHVSGTYGLWLQWKPDGSGDACHLVEAVQYAVSKEYTPNEYLRLKRWCERYSSTCGAGILVPAEVTAGTGIGPDMDWASVDGYIVLGITP